MQRKSLIIKIIIAIVLLAAPQVLPYLIDSSYYFYLIDLMGIFAVGALGLGLLIGFTGQISMGHAAFAAIGAFFSGYTTLKLGWPFWVSMPLSGFAAAICGFALGFPALRLSGQYLAIATVGFGVAIPQILLKWEKVSGGFDGLKPPAPMLFGHKMSLEEDYYYIVLIVLAIMIWMLLNLVKSRTGRAFIAVRDSEIAAQAMGVNLTKYKTLAFAISAFYAGIGGSLYAHMVRFIGATDFNLGMSVNYLTAIVLGGLTSVPGFVLGGAFITVLPHAINSFSRSFPAGLKTIAQNLPQVLVGLILILVVLYLPMGFMGLYNKLREKSKTPATGGEHHDAAQG
jgi:branched-chain amino acid transport system permease protein